MGDRNESDQINDFERIRDYGLCYLLELEFLKNELRIM